MFAEAVRGVDYGTMMEPNFSNHASAHKECTVNMLMEIAMIDKYLFELWAYKGNAESRKII